MSTNYQCKVCGNILDRDNDFQQSVGVCRSCFEVYSKVDMSLNEHADEKVRRIKLEKMAGGLN